MTRNAQWGYDTGINALLPGERSTQVDLVTVHFGDVTAKAEAFIEASEQLVGAIAWVRSPRLLDAMRTRPVSLIVNKEFVLRTPGKERQALDKLRRPASGHDAAVRVAGDCSRGAFTGLMHHKFLVRLTRGIPAAVWTGSFNFTSGAAGNFENAVEIDDPGVAMMFYDEFRLLWGISEPLDFRQGRPAGTRPAGRQAKKKPAVQKSVGAKKPTPRAATKTEKKPARAAPKPAKKAA
ncbi:MAG: hypothetical protein J0J04_04895 [Microbacterium sp.]|uniref:phospholipase D-like domain-containing protein n=1 Tax=Microbacterium sp. TaxID=51671 RepID=UPI001AC7D4AF|nr:phospholipase D-like domain-containing protein [Microbacterium sp.]MBN9214146.1 hypothetical protein [Microbacterium sp.]